MDDDFDELRAKVQRDLLVEELMELTGESRDKVVTTALQERLARLTGPVSKAERRQQMLNLLDSFLWQLSAPHRGDKLSREKEDEIFGYGPEGV